MSFAALDLRWVAVGLAGLAGALYLLQRLRVRFTERVVPTSLFWREALLESRARERTQRFRHPLAYLFLLVLAACLWIAGADPRFGGEPEREVVLLLDRSAASAVDGRLEAALGALERELAAAPAARVVASAGAGLETLLGAGEERALILPRLAALAPQAAPLGLESALGHLVTPARDGRPLEIVVLSGAPISEAARELLPDGVALRRAAPVEAQSDFANVGFVEAGFGPAQSGAWDRVDVLAVVAGRGAAPPERLEVRLDDAALEPDVRAEAEPPVRSDVRTERRFWLRDVPAGGGRLVLGLGQSGDSLALDDRAALRLPSRRPLRVALDPALEAPFAALIAADPGLVLAANGADVAIRTAGSGLGGALPALEFAPAAAGRAAIRIEDGSAEAARLLAEALGELGLDELDADALATDLQRTVRVEAARPEAGDARRIVLWQELISPLYAFSESAAFPLFAARALRWLGRAPDEWPRAVAGEPSVALAFKTLGDGASERSLDPVGQAFVPPVAGAYRSTDGRLISASLLDRDTTTPPEEGAVLDAPARGGRHWPRAAAWFGLLALAGLALDWWLAAKERIP